MTNILGTGFGGFIGAATRAEAESRGHKVWSYDRSDGLDILDRERLISEMVDHDIDAVIHLAGVLGTHELFDTPDLAVDVNVQGSLNVLEACRVTGATYTGISMPDVFPSLYTATKIAAVRIAKAYNHTHGVPVAHVTAFNAFGEGQAVGPGHPQKIVPTFAVELANGRPCPIWGDGTQAVDLVDVVDLGRAMVNASEYVSGGVDWAQPPWLTIDGGSGVQWSVLDVARECGVALDRPCLVEFRPMRRGEQPVRALVATPPSTLRRTRDEVRDRLHDVVRWYAERYTGENDPWR